MDLKKRIKLIDEIVYNSINDKPELNYAPDLIINAITEYADNLEKWKTIFSVSNNLDRHKVASLTVHYFLKYSPIDYNIKYSKPAGEFANETASITIAIGHLHDGKNITLNEREHGSLLKILKLHRGLIITKKYDWKNVELFVRNFSFNLCEIEKNHNLSSRYPKV